MLQNPSNKIKEQFLMQKFNKLEYFEITPGESEKSFKYTKVGTSIIAPSNIFWNSVNSVCVIAYPNYFTLFYQAGQEIVYQRTLYHSIMDGYFWEDLFFFTTDASIFMLVPNFVCHDAVVIEIAKLTYQTKKSLLFNTAELFAEGTYYDSIQPELQKRPPGQLKILLIYDMKLAVINQNHELGFVKLDHPFI